ncbi:3-deoxy-D-manno-octulosonic acid kinase [Vibrio proteolyticus]|nr:3-deoxy-D-manno-octulosonic acid kinase [Vibrio proteolyticus]
MKTQQRKNQMIWYDEQLLSEDPHHCFDPQFWQAQNKILGSAQGRGTTWFVQTEKLAAALRHYRRGGLFGKLVNDHYWFSGWTSTRSYLEFDLLQRLRQAGVNVPRPIAARAVRTGLLYQADLLSEKIPHARDLVSVLQRQPLDEALYLSIGQMIRRMHDARVNHTDLNIHNILLDDQQQVWLIDFDKCAAQRGERWKAANLERLKRSFIKEQQRAGIHWQPAQWQAILTGYSRD